LASRGEDEEEKGRLSGKASPLEMFGARGKPGRGEGESGSRRRTALETEKG